MPARSAPRWALILLLVVPLLGWQPATADDGPIDDATGDPTNVSTHATARQRIRLEVLPQIVQHGGRVADADHASTAVVATVRPVRKGRRVELEVLRGDTWEHLATARQNRRGRAQLAVPPAADGRASSYRVRALAHDGLPAITSAPATDQRWLQPTWTDEFTGTTLRPDWRDRGLEHVHESRRSCAKGDPRAVQVAGGAVRLSVIKDPDATTRCRIVGRDAVPGRFAYRLNGHIGTEGAFSFRYGVAAARVKFQRLRGQHGAFWLQPSGGIHPGALGNEIDVVEYFGDHHPQGGLASFVHRFDGARKVTTGGWIDRPESYLASRSDGWSKGYHVFSVEWTPRQLVYRIDGKVTGRVRGRISAERQFVILSLIAANYEIPKIREGRLPQHMYVDWVRVWETGG
ncbi:glycosyl hydrolase family protein [Nocardioides oleivorans]|uniref:Glycosyl hydrolase family protein n=1 Tax=Nocardioides oleivorans TaxID=273676 RepID=A0A4Q2RVY1_9ACTN|nr:family 16 glycosylhydrolase [Nocardioides oleivorans]RYB92095.1 glycosyl hydrolase family protein [Nocardioides oleivorans]